MPAWLKDAVFYEIYPQSFYDSNGDGIGDINGIIEKQDYVRGLGCNALWINPCFDSPFKDGGYDVRDYKKVAPRYGTNDDLVRLFREAHERGMRVLLDLVPGHTSEEHEWFRQSSKAEPNEYSGRYVWTRNWIEPATGFAYIAGESERAGAYLLNFFKCQPALNYGFLRVDQGWQMPVDHPECLATREAIKDVMRFWMDLGCDGYRVDMAGSLVKNDDAEQSGTAAIWRDVREMMDEEYPQCALVAEWGRPTVSLKAGFHMDFYLDRPGNGYSTLMRDWGNHEDGADHSYFKKDGGGSIRRFLDEYVAWYEATRGDGYISLITCNHDTIRARRTLSPRELALAYAFLFTMPGVPFLYYGDEIGMRYLELPTKDGGYVRTGSRTPMQWGGGKNRGFSTAPEQELYLPADPADDAPTVEAAEADPNSLLHVVRALIALRHAHEDLQADAHFEPLVTADSKPFVYRRGGLVLAVNPSGRECGASQQDALPGAALPQDAEAIFALGGGGALRGGVLVMEPQSFVVMEERRA